MRDAARTNEPFGEEPVAVGPTYRGAFVVHQHAATRMHYDLRLEVGGILSSFAIPRGPTLDPASRHLAMHTEDHPIEYLDFEDVIPEKTYGAGPMIVWDCGSVRFLDTSAEEGLQIGKLHFALEGRKLKGRYGLIKIKKPKAGSEGNEWLFMKKQDAYASTTVDVVASSPRSVLSGLTVDELREMPRVQAALEARAVALGAEKRRVDGRTISPMLASVGDLPKARGYLYELKMDGVRIIATKDERGVDLRYRSGREGAVTYPEIARAVRALPATRVVLDGEVVAFDDHGKPSFGLLQHRIHVQHAREMRIALAEVPIVFFAFDILSIGDLDTSRLPLVDRKRLLAELVRAPGLVRVLDHLEEGGDRLLAFCEENGLEGIVAKKKDGPYRFGPGRTADWIKVKCQRSDLFVVVGHTRGERNRGRLGAVDIAAWEGERLVVRGKAGSGLSEGVIATLLERLGPLEIPESAAVGRYLPAPNGRTFVRPEVVVRVRYQELTDDGHLRHPVFLEIVDDASPSECVAGPRDRELDLDPEPDPDRDVDPERAPDLEAGLDRKPAPKPGDAAAPVARVTNRDKLFWPDDGYKKGDLVDYYTAIAPTLLPYLQDRPVMLVRYPDGIAGKMFYQWNVPRGMPAWVKSVSLGKHMRAPDGDENHKKNVFLIDGLESLIYIANLACIPVHILASRLSTPRETDFLTIDFDVGLVDLRTAIPLAHALRELCASLGLVGFPKTSGQTGLHVFVPLGRGVTPEAARTLADLLGTVLVEHHPKIATMERIVKKRGAKVYVDTGQTGASRTIVAPYSVRATRGARVSTPLVWDEVVPDLDPARFTIKTVLARVAEVGDPMAPLLTTPVEMPEVMQRLAKLLAPRARG